MVRKRKAGPVEELEEAFRELSQQTPDKQPTLIELVSAHREWIQKLVGQGHSYNRIAEAMSNKGVVISPHTLRQYFGKLERSDRRAMRGELPKLKPSRKAAGSEAPAMAVLNSVQANNQPREIIEQPTRNKPLLPGDTEL